MELLTVPRGWVALDDHLLRYHGLETDAVDGLDADTARALHRELHDTRFTDVTRQRRRHTHRR